MDLRKLIKNILFVFLALSFAYLIYIEFSPKSETNQALIAAQNDKTGGTETRLSNTENQGQKGLQINSNEKMSSSANEIKSQSSKVIAYYFHGTYRCITCRTIEKYSKEAIENYFSDELNNGKLIFKSINVEEPENRHFIQNYQLFTRSLVLSLVKKDKEIKWKVLPDVWKYYRDKTKFFQYVKNEVEKFLKET
jgi:hypothetical protein